MTACASRRRAVAALAAWAAAALLTACATPPPAQPSRSGRLLLKIDANGNAAAQTLTANFDLNGNARRGQMALFNPLLGSQLALAQWDDSGARLTAEGRQRRFDSLDEMTRAVFGEPIPLAAVLSWLDGQPWPDAAASPTALGFEQLGWQVDLSAWRKAAIVQARRASPAPAVSLQAVLR